MKLKDYIKKTGLTCEQFAGMVGVSRQTIYNIITKRHPPSLKIIRAIEKVSNGEVTISDIEFEPKLKGLKL